MGRREKKYYTVTEYHSSNPFRVIAGTTLLVIGAILLIGIAGADHIDWNLVKIDAIILGVGFIVLKLDEFLGSTTYRVECDTKQRTQIAPKNPIRIEDDIEAIDRLFNNEE